MNPSDTSLTEPRRIREDDLRQLFLDARTHNVWLDKPVPDSVSREIYDLVKFGPTSMNTQPMRLLFLRTAAARERLRPYLAPAYIDKTMAAPITVIVGHDLAFHEHLPKLFPHNPNANSVFEGKLPLIEATAYSQRQPSGRLSHHRRACARARLRVPCRGSTMQRWIANSSQTRGSSRISFATSVMAIIRSSSRARYAMISRPSARSSDCAASATWAYGGSNAVAAVMRPMRRVSSLSKELKTMSNSKQQTGGGPAEAVDAAELDALMQANIVRVFNERNSESAPCGTGRTLHGERNPL